MKKSIILFMLVLAFNVFLPTAVHAETDADTYKLIDDYLSRTVERAHIPGMSVIIVDKDTVLFSGTYGNCSSIDTPFIIGSMSKSFTAVSVMQLAEAGKLSLDDKIITYLPDVSEGDRITVRQLLNQTSGLGEYQRFSDLKITDSYGTHLYANVNYGLLGRIIETVSGMSYDEYITKNIFQPLQMNHSAASLEKSRANGLIAGFRNYFGIPVAGEPDYPTEDSWGQVASGYISASGADMGKYLQMYLNEGGDIIAEESVDTVFYDNVYVEADTPYYYGMGFTMSDNAEYGEPILGHSGLVENYMSNMFILPESGIGVAILVNTNDYFITNAMMDSASISLVLSLMGKDTIEIDKTKYIMSHMIMNGIYLAIFLTALLPLVFINKYKKKLPTMRKRRIFCGIGLHHILFPTVLLLFPRFISTPLWAVRLYVPDLYWVIISSAAFLYIGGITKAVLLYRQRERKR